MLIVLNSFEAARPYLFAGFNNVLFQQFALKEEIFASKYFCGFCVKTLSTKIYAHSIFQNMSSTKRLEIGHMRKFMAAKLKDFTKFSYYLSNVEILGRNIL